VVKKNKLEEVEDPLVEQISASFKEANKDPLPLITQSIEIQANETLNLFMIK
jgi:hypothetical protein